MLGARKSIIKSEVILNLIFACWAQGIHTIDLKTNSQKFILHKTKLLRAWPREEEALKTKLVWWSQGLTMQVFMIIQMRWAASVYKMQIFCNLCRSADGPQWGQTYVIVQADFKVTISFNCHYCHIIVMNSDVTAIQECLLFWDSPTSASGVPR